MMSDRLFKQTVDKKINWEMSESRNPIATIGDYRVHISYVGDEGDFATIVSITNMYGEAVESFSDNDLSQLKPITRGYAGYWALLNDLRQLAFRQAVGADKALDNILDSLNDDW